MKNLLFVFFSLLYSSQLVCSNINWTFPPEVLSTPGASASDPHVAMDSNGNAVAVWVENGVIQSKYKLVNMDWDLIARLSGSVASSPQVVQDPNGNATAVWIEGSNSHAVVKVASKLFKKPWSASVVLSSAGATNPSLAVDVAGNVIVVWAKNGHIETTVKLFGHNWQGTSTLANPGDNAAFPKIAIGGSSFNASAVVVWHSTTSPVNIVYASTKPVSFGAWSTPEAISEPDLQAAYAQVAVDMNGNATAVWYRYDVTGSVYSSVVLQAASKLSSRDWTSPVSLSDPGMRNPATLSARVAYDTTGNAVALWSTSFDDETFSIQSAIKPIYGSWTQPLALINDNLYSYQADLSVCSLGDALALYLFYNGTALQIQSSELDITGFMNSIWSAPLTISAGTQNAFPSGAATLTGNVIYSAGVWLVNNGMYNSSVVAATGSKTLILPPSQLKVVQSINNFGVFSEDYNTLSWHASVDRNVVGYIIYRNGVFLQQVGSNVLQIVDDNRVQNGSVTYGVASVDSQQSHSRIVTITFP